MHALLQAGFSILDLGLSPALTREVARAGPGVQALREVRNLLRSIELSFVGMALAVALAIAALASHIVERWLTLGSLAPAGATDAITLMGVVVALRLLAGAYRGVIVGRQRLVWLNGAMALFATARAAGVIAVLAWISASIEAFFAFQVAVSVIETACYAIAAWRLLPSADPARFSTTSLRSVARFSGSLFAITLLSLVLGQADKLILSSLLPLADFGYYALAASVAGALNLLVAPVGSVAFPRLSELAARGVNAPTIDAFHRFAQLVTLAVAPAAAVLALLAEPVLAVWTGDALVTRHAAPLLSCLVVGAMAFAFMSLPYMLPLARGRGRAPLVVNAALVVVFLPGLYWAIAAHGALGGACAWSALNVTGALLAPAVMRDSLPAHERVRWLVRDVALPAGASFAAVALVSVWLPAAGPSWRIVASVALCYLAALGAAALLLPIAHRKRAIYWRASPP